jgi:hypothetical protein
MMAQTHINFNDPGIRSFLQIYHHICKTLNFTTLEPPANAGRPGGRGKKVRKRVKIAEFFSPIGLTTVFWVTTNQEVWLGLVVSELNLGSLPLWVWPGGERGFAAGNCRWSIPVIVIFRYLFY